ncbi:sulfotransferase family 2 domain-containing protein [Methylobacterium sp. WSM2598]|uniref:sulfotransferase family 2 domain-containing protein n=1 Tax=Methylobacterium sp. WSM2598 TaxID=398261 RepID=UPI00035DE946|nr:sulfotransferase family 2 domain-containing protein [Methylobacterium sp. WSM2598]
MRQISILHIGETGGTALRAVVDAHKARHPSAAIEVFPHHVTLAHLRRDHPESGIVFFVREPVRRFVSGFNSRLRRGQPRYNVPWSPDEELAFTRFPDASALGEALGADDPGRRDDAARTMRSIAHARRDLTHYLGSVEALDAARDRILLIGSQETFDCDVAKLKVLLRIDDDIHPLQDDVAAHRNPAALPRDLTPAAEHNLKIWYSNDYQIYEWCRPFREERDGRNAGTRASSDDVAAGPS